MIGLGISNMAFLACVTCSRRVKNNKGNNKKRNGTWNSSKDNKKDKKPLSEVVCYKCNEKGNIKRYCKNPKKKTQNSNKKDEYANAVEQVDTTEITAMVSELNIRMIQKLHMASVTIIDDWWHDSGATTHVCNNRDLFKTYKETKDGHEVKMGDNHTSKVIGSGNMEIQFTFGKKLTLMNVLHVPNIRKNLVFCFKLCKSRVKAVIESDKVILSKANVFVGKAYACDGMFKLNINKTTSSAYWPDCNFISSFNIECSTFNLWTNFASWQQRIRLYCRGKENGQHETHAKENKMMLERFSQNTVDPLALMSNVSNPHRYSPSSSTSSSTQVSQHLADNPYLDSSISPMENLIKNLIDTLDLLTQSYKTFLPQTNNQLRTSYNARNQATIQDGRVVVQNVHGRQNRGQGMNPQVEVQLDMGEVRTELGMLIRVKQDRLSATTATDLALNVDNVFQADDCDAFDSDMDEAPSAQTMFMANLSSADPVTDEAIPSYDLNILSEIQDHDHYQDAVCAHHKEHYVKDNDVPVVHNNVSSVLNDAFMMIYNDMCEPHAQSVPNPSWNTVVKNSLTAELATYKEQVELHEIIKDNHAPAIVHNTKDTLEIAEITRKKINDKMKDPECVTRKVKIAPHDYSKENFLATFTPQKQLTLEQIFCSHDLIKLKSEALKEQTTVSRPIKALTVYSPNTPATLVPRVLPTKSQVKIHIFTRIQLFLEFDKTCKKRITPTRLTEGERGFEQTKECYLKEVIPFFKTLKDNFEGIQKALTKEIKEIKDVFEELEAEVAQNVVDRKHDAIERKNLLIANDKLIAECLSK
nr:retrovirus-related Pol polyprotein from transposon TNT 1-94 [Tanacetum cinerariifolium]